MNEVPMFLRWIVVLIASPILITIGLAAAYFMICNLLTFLRIGEAQYPYAWRVCVLEKGVWHSPLWHTAWSDGRLLADEKPTVDGEHGIHCAKSFWNWELHLIFVLTVWFGGRILLVKMWEPVVEYELGYQASGVEIVMRQPEMEPAEGRQP